MEKYHQMLKRMELTEELKNQKLSTGYDGKVKDRSHNGKKMQNCICWMSH